MKKILLTLLIGLFIISFTSALEIDNWVKDVSIVKDQPIIIGSKQIPYKPIWEKYAPQKIDNVFGLGETLWEGAIDEHKDQCGSDCSTTFYVSLTNEGILIEDFKTETLQEDGTWFEEPIISEKFYFKVGEEEIIIEEYNTVCIENGKISINGSKEKTCSREKTGSHIQTNDIWEEFNVEDEFDSGDYKVKVEGEKKASRTVDWKIKVQGKWINSWAVWGASDLTIDLLSYYKFDNDNIDAVGFQNIGGTAGFDSDGIINQARNLSEDAQNWGTHLGNSGNFSFNLWVRPDVGANWGVSDYRILAVDGGDAAGAEGELTWKTSGNNFFRIYSNGGQRDLALTNPTEGVWTMMTIVMSEGTNMSGYINGTLIGSNSAGFTNFEIKPTITLTLFGSTTSVRELKDGAVDELAIYNRSLTQSEITELYNSGVGDQYPFSSSSVTINSPANLTISSTNIIFVNGSATQVGATVSNMSLYTNQSGTFEIVNSTTGLTLNTEEVTWSHNFGSDGTYLWSIQACDSDGDCAFAGENRTLTIDTSSASVTINNPEDIINYGFVGKNETLNWSIAGSFQSLWYNYNGTNVTVFGAENTTNLLLENNNFNVTFFANNSAGSEN